MSKRPRSIGLVASMVLMLLAAGLIAGPSSGAGTSAGAKFKPKKYVGHWSGEWANQTFATSGPATMDLKVKGTGDKQKFIGVFDLGGTAFGCPDPAPRKRTMKKGKGPNTWNSKGFRISYSNDFGPIKLTYKRSDESVHVTGVSPCGAEITYEFNGTLTTKLLTGTTDIELQGAPFATATLEVRKET